MTIDEMHIAFRALGQQIGMQNVRVILPETIDLFIDNAVNEFVRETIQKSGVSLSGIPNLQPSAISALNALHTLIKSFIVLLDRTSENIILNSDVENGIYKVKIPFDLITIDKPLVFINFSVKYENDNKYYKTRIINLDSIGDVINDFCNAPTKENPIVVLNQTTEITNVSQAYKEALDIYIGKTFKIKPAYLKIDYVSTPAKVNSIGAKVNCDLPNYLHHEIVERAVLKYNTSVGHIIGRQYANNNAQK